MKKVLMPLLCAAALMTLAACGDGPGDPGLMGRLPGGYDAYITIDPERANFPEILEIVEDNLPEYELNDIEEMDLGLDLFDWNDWVDELGVEPGEIGFVGMGEDMEFLAVFLPCDGEKLRDFVESAGGGDETEFLEMDGYTVMVIAWEDDDQIDELEEALQNPLSEEGDFQAMAARAVMDDPALAFLFYEEITEFPVMCFVSDDGDATEMSMAMIFDDEEMEMYADIFAEGLQSRSIMLPGNTMAAVRTSFDTETLIDRYDEMAREAGTDAGEMEAGLAFIGFSSMEEFIGVFKGDFCIAVTEIELDQWGEPSGGAGIMALSLQDPEKLEASLNMISTLAESTRESFQGTTAFRMDIGVESIWYFIYDDVFYLSYAMEPEEIADGMKAEDFFTGSASEGFMGGAANPDMIVEGLSLDRDTERLIEEVFAGEAAFSVSFQDGLAFSKVTIGPGAITSIVEIAMEMGQ